MSTPLRHRYARRLSKSWRRASAFLELERLEDRTLLDAATVQLTQLAFNVKADGSGDQVAVALSAAVDHDVHVSFRTTDDTAVSTGPYPDYAAGPDFTVVIPAFSTDPVPLPVTVLWDNVVQDLETFTVELFDAAGADLGGPAAAVVTLVDNRGPRYGPDAPPEAFEPGDSGGGEDPGGGWSAPSQGGAEGLAPGGDPLTVQFEASGYAVWEDSVGWLITRAVLNRAAPQTLSVPIRTYPGTATPGADYVDVNTSLIFPQGSTYQWVGVRILPDNVYEGNETFRMVLGSGGGATPVAPSNVAVTIADDDPVPSVTLEQGPYQIAEPGGLVPVFIHLSNPSAGMVWVHAVVQDSAPPCPQPSASWAQRDYLYSNGLLPFAPLQTRNYFYVQVFDDTISEPTEYVNIAVPDANGAVVPNAPQHASLAILDNDPVPRVHFTQTTYVQAEGEVNALITVALSNPSSQPTSVHYSTATNPGDTASPGVDYDPTSGTLTFAPLDTSKTFTVRLHDDHVHGPDKRLSLSLDSPVGLTIDGPMPAALTIQEADALPAVSFRDGVYYYPETQSVARVWARLSLPSATPVTFHVYTTPAPPPNPAAAPNVNYLHIDTVITFPALATTAPIDFPVLDDHRYGLDKQVVLVIDSVTSNAQLASGQPQFSTVVLQDADPLTLGFTQPYFRGTEGQTVTVLVQPAGVVERPVTVSYVTHDRTAKAGTDYQYASGSLTVQPGSPAPITLTLVNDHQFDADKRFVVHLTSAEPRAVWADVEIVIIDVDLTIVDLPAAAPPDTCTCAPDPVRTPAGLAGQNNAQAGLSDGLVRYADGAVKLAVTDLASGAGGSDWGHTRSWSNAPHYSTDGLNGAGTVVSQQPRAVQDPSGNHVAIITSGTDARLFDRDAGGAWHERYGGQEQLLAPPGADVTLTDATGDVLTFYGFGAELGPALRGQFKRRVEPSGLTTEAQVGVVNGVAQVARVQRTIPNGSGLPVQEAYVYGHVSGGANAGKLASVLLERSTDAGAHWANVRQVTYAYYDGVEAYGNATDLKTATVCGFDAAGAAQVIDTSYYRYYRPNEANGYTHGLKYLLGPASFERARAAGYDPLNVNTTDAQLADYADGYFQYDATPQHRVTLSRLQGQGCSSCANGLGTYTYAYSQSPAQLHDVNAWLTKTVETLPDGNQNVVYSNFQGQVMLFDFVDQSAPVTGQWRTLYRYDLQGRLAWRADPSTWVGGHNEAYADLVGYANGKAQALALNSGVFTVYDYGVATGATDAQAGDVAGYLKQTFLRRGLAGLPTPLGATRYLVRTAGGLTVYPVGQEVAYRGEDYSGQQVTSYAYAWRADAPLVPQTVTVTRPAVRPDQNGSGLPDVEATALDRLGRVTWERDADGFLHYTAYDASGAIGRDVTDVMVDAAHAADYAEAAPPAGWATPPGGGLHLVTRYELDTLGRPTKITDPNQNAGSLNGNTTYVVYKDHDHEVRTYAGWDSATNTPTGPTRVVREDRAGSYVETLTMTAAPHLTNGRPDGAEAVGGVLTLSRQFISRGGQVAHQDDYFNLTGLTYTTAVVLGTAGTHYYSTAFGYDARGRLNRVWSPTGTYTQTDSDGLGRLRTVWVGTAAANVPSDNLVLVRALLYDGNTVGDGNLTQVTDYPGLGAPARVQLFGYDWRDRLITSKAGAETNEAADVNRPEVVRAYDNLDELVAEEIYDGDGQPVADARGTVVGPAAAKRRARTAWEYDEQGRVFRTHEFLVDQTTGALGAALHTDVWYGSRGQVLKAQQPGGLVQKDAYDGAGRVTVSYTTDGGGDFAWADAGNVLGDAVLEQVETTYDLSDNPILVTTRQRFHDETATGDLHTPALAPKARVSYAAAYYDRLGRVTAAVDVGTNGGAAWTRPTAPPGASPTALVTSYTYGPAGWLDTSTDPRGVVTKRLYDALGRVTTTIEAYTGAPPSDHADRTTEYAYDAAGHLVLLTARLPGNAVQQTAWGYGVRTAWGSGVNSNDLLLEVWHPDPATGQPSSAWADRYTVNALGEAVTATDRNGTVHGYTFDPVGRPVADLVTTVGANVDGAVRRLETAYDEAGRSYRFTSYDAASGGTVVNQVQQAYNGLGQLTVESQAHAGAAVAGTPAVHYAYSEMPGGANHSRLLSLSYPNGRALGYTYAAGVDSNVSRLSSLTDGAVTLEAYAYLGLDTVVQRGHPQPGVDLTYIKRSTEPVGDAGDPYTGLDRYGRVAQQRWRASATGTDKAGYQYGYDLDGNVLFKKDLVNAAFSELYQPSGLANGATNGYDRLGQLTAFARGVLSDASNDGIPDTVAAPSATSSWDLDGAGNWRGVTANGAPQARTHNAQNEVTAVGARSLAYDRNGNLTADGGTLRPDGVRLGLVYDAWDRLVEVRSVDQGNAVLWRGRYDALGRRVFEEDYTQPAGRQRTDLYYSADWQVLEERVGTVGAVATAVYAQYVWSPVYVDALVERDRDADGNGTLEERRYALQDPNANVVAVLDPTGAVVERYAEDPYGTVTVLDANWATRPNGSLYDWRYLHQGGRFTAVIGLYAFRNRDYSPSQGRWTEPDPEGFNAGDTNLYRAEGNSPVNATDPFGLESWWQRFDRAFQRGWDRLSEGIAGLIGPDNIAGPINNQSLRKDAHGILGVIGFVPVLGTPAQLIDAGFYLAEGDLPNAGLSAFFAIPFTKWFGLAKKGMQAARMAKLGAKEAAALGKVGAKGAAREGRVAKSVCETAPQRPKARQRNGKRREYMGQNPNKSSTTYRDVVARMRREGKIVGEGDNAMVKASDGTWIPLKDAEFSHKQDAVKWWNEQGKYWGPKHEKVRQFMTDPNNYVLDKPLLNRSTGAKLKGTGYDPPAPCPGGPFKPPGS
jgi:RHS repeat-associated protein